MNVYLQLQVKEDYQDFLAAQPPFIKCKLSSTLIGVEIYEPQINNHNILVFQEQIIIEVCRDDNY